MSSTSLDNTDKTTTLVATVNPSEAEDKTVVWSSSNTQIAKVDQSGNVTAVGNGVAYITATSTKNAFATAMCKVTVTGMTKVVVPPTDKPTTPTEPTTPTTPSEPTQKPAEKVKEEIKSTNPKPLSILSIANNNFSNISAQINLSKATDAQKKASYNFV